MNIPMYKNGSYVLVHPERVDWMEQAGWSVIDNGGLNSALSIRPESIDWTEQENETDNEVIENGSNNGA